MTALLAYPAGAIIRGSQTDVSEHPLCRARLSGISLETRRRAVLALYRAIAFEDSESEGIPSSRYNREEHTRTRRAVAVSHTVVVRLVQLGSIGRQLSLPLEIVGTSGF